MRENMSGLLTGDYTDGRRLAFLYNAEEVKSKGKPLQRAIQKWLTLLDKK